jgi:hypothetical protein
MLKPGQLRAQGLRNAEISERHRHRYEFNREFEEVLTAHGLKITGETPGWVYVEICEIEDHPWLSRLPVPSGVQIEAAGAASAVQRVHRKRFPRSRGRSSGWS